jgi:hypothetical protein
MLALYRSFLHCLKLSGEFKPRFFANSGEIGWQKLLQGEKNWRVFVNPGEVSEGLDRYYMPWPVRTLHYRRGATMWYHIRIYTIVVCDRSFIIRLLDLIRFHHTLGFMVQPFKTCGTTYVGVWYYPCKNRAQLIYTKRGMHMNAPLLFNECRTIDKEWAGPGRRELED